MKFLFSSLFFICFHQSLTAKASLEKFAGFAKALNGSFEYTEQHELRLKDGRPEEKLTKYLIGDQIIASLQSNFSVDLKHPDYEFSDYRTSYQEGFRNLKEGAQLFFRMTKDSELKVKNIQLVDDLVAGQGFHYFLKDKLEALEQGAVLDLQLAFPGRLTLYRFRARAIKAPMPDDHIRIRLEFDNWFFRIFAPYIEMDYSKSSKRLIRYYGLSNLKDSRGKNSKVEINYEYPN